MPTAPWRVTYSLVQSPFHLPRTSTRRFVAQEATAQGKVVGVDITTGDPISPAEIGVWDNWRVKRQMLDSSAVIAEQLLLVDEIIRAGKQIKKPGGLRLRSSGRSSGTPAIRRRLSSLTAAPHRYLLRSPIPQARAQTLLTPAEWLARSASSPTLSAPLCSSESVLADASCSSEFDVRAASHGRHSLTVASAAKSGFRQLSHS